MASVDELVAAFGAALEGSDLDGMIAVLAPGAVVWHNRDRKVVDARENMAAIGMLGQIVRDAAIATVRLEPTSGGFVYQFALRGTVVSSGKAPRAERWRRASVFPTKAGTFDCNPKNVETYKLNSTS